MRCCSTHPANQSEVNPDRGPRYASPMRKEWLGGSARIEGRYNVGDGDVYREGAMGRASWKLAPFPTVCVSIQSKLLQARHALCNDHDSSMVQRASLPLGATYFVSYTVVQWTRARVGVSKPSLGTGNGGCGNRAGDRITMWKTRYLWCLRSLGMDCEELVLLLRRLS